MNICYSGGAEGADEFFGRVAEDAGHEVRHFSFKGHRNSVGNRNIFILDKDKLDLANTTLDWVNKNVLHRSFPAHSDFVTKLLQRNFFQVNETESVYAVAGLDGNSVYGGTAWAIECYKKLHPESDKIYVFDQEKASWFQWNYMTWIKLDKQPPKPSGRWTGIGNKKLTEVGENAILELFK